MEKEVIDLINSLVEEGKLLEACEGTGCFRVVNHWLPAELQAAFTSLLDLSADVKRRTPTSSAAVGMWLPRRRTRSTRRSGSMTPPPLLTAMPSAPACTPRLITEWPCQFQINKYNFTEETVGSAGVHIHTDSWFLIVLQEDESVGGLKVMDKSGTFVAVDTVTGTFLVNLGDVAKVWSNGRLHNVKHRVQCKEAAARVSIALFLLAPKDDKVEPPAELVDPRHPRLYKTFGFDY